MRIQPRVLFILAALGCSAISNAGSPPSGVDSAQWQREDIVVFREQFLAVDKSFTPLARAAAQQRLAQLERRSGALSGADFIVELCRIAALADNGHTHCMPAWFAREICHEVAAVLGSKSPWCQLRDPDFEVPEFQTTPIGFYPFGEAFSVIGVADKDSDLLGSRLVAVESRSVESIRTTLRTFAGGLPAFRDLVAADVLRTPEQLHAAGLSSSNDSVLYEFVTLGGKKVQRRFSVRQPPGAPTTWRGLPAADRTPWAFQEPGKLFRYRDAPEIDSLVVQVRKNIDARDERLADFLQRAETERAARGRNNIVLDMRFNSGGNLYLTRDFMRRWPARAPGHFFVLTSRRTFSAGIASVAYLKQAGGNRVSIIGEPVGDRLMFFSDGLPIQLPHSGRFFQPAVVRMDYKEGCRDYDDCSEAIAQPGRPTATALLPSPGPVERLPISVATLDPDVPAPWTIESWLTGRDPMLEAVTALVGKQTK